MNTLLSPKQVAQALRVSESSVKRWCDKGSITTTYTDGGHRRIRMGDLADFVRANRLAIQDFVPMGLAQSGPAVGALENAPPILVQAILEGNEDQCSQIVMELYLAKIPIYQICDLVIAEAFSRIGDKWACGQAEIYQERLGCKIAQRILHRLQMLLPDPAESAPVALGCTTEGDLYCLGSTMVELVLRDAGWRAISLGEDLPISSMAMAIERHKPSIVWLSCSYLQNVDRFVEQYNQLYDTFHSRTQFALGGQALTPEVQARIKFDLMGTKMQDVHEFVSRAASTSISSDN